MSYPATCAGEWVYWHDVRWQCPTCGRFIADSAVESEDYFDPSEYFGIGCRTWGECSKCGRVDEPRCIPTVEHRARESR